MSSPTNISGRHTVYSPGITVNPLIGLTGLELRPGCGVSRVRRAQGQTRRIRCSLVPSKREPYQATTVDLGTRSRTRCKHWVNRALHCLQCCPTTGIFWVSVGVLRTAHHSLKRRGISALSSSSGKSWVSSPNQVLCGEACGPFHGRIDCSAGAYQSAGISRNSRISCALLPFWSFSRANLHAAVCYFYVNGSSGSQCAKQERDE